MLFPIKNEYNTLANAYQKSNVKPDKQFSILPTVLKLVGDVNNKTVLDLGCGDGFFTREIASQGAKKVIAIDNSEKQIELAMQENKHLNIEYRLADIFQDSLPIVDIINSPFVLNYCQNLDAVRNYLMKLFNSLKLNGRLILVIDLPSGKNLEKFGARKTLAKDEDATPFSIELFDRESYLCTLHAVYFKESTVKRELEKVGFKNITSHRPIISSQGIEKFGEEFWEGYKDNCELGYITAEKYFGTGSN